jgi:predicted dehydrogenase
VIQVGIIGYGYWGPNVARNLAAIEGIKVAAVADLSAKNRAKAALAHPTAKIVESVAEVVNDPQIDAIAVVTPVGTHFELASSALKAGKHVLVEKPMTASADEAKRLCDLADAQKRTLMVDHTFVYTGAVRKIAEVMAGGNVGEPMYYDSVRVNLGLVQPDVDVVWDLAVHDVSIVNALVRERPTAVSAVGVKHVPGQPESIAYVTLHYPGSFLVHIHVNWLAPVKIRRTLIGCTKQMIVYDDLETSEKVKIYDKGVEMQGNPERAHELRVGYRAGDMWSPKVELAEALKVEMQHFKECIETGKKPITDGVAGAQIVNVLEAATQSMRQNGRIVELGK